MFVIGLVGAFGSGCSYIAKEFLVPRDFQYISLSNILKDEYIKDNPGIKREDIKRPSMQDFGNKVRQEKGANYLAKVAFENIDSNKFEFIVIDSIRNPEEIKYLKSKIVDFYVFAIFAEESVIWERVNKLYNDNHGYFSIDEKRDKGEKIEYGQRVSDCFLLSDLIISNNETIQGKNDAYNRLGKKVADYLDLFQGKIKEKRPTEIESIMAMAYANSLRSSCLKRKVGAVIVDENHNVFSSGFNEIPPFELPCKSLYGECYRNSYKKEIGNLVETEKNKDQIMGKIKLLEKCRALHAEENAIINIAKFGSASVVKKATLYTTTYPCNLCANKISQVNIRKVVYFEPYPVEEAKDTLNRARIEQEMFEGVTYNSYFKVYSEIIL
jgi:deoxycytidylate deaminase